MPLKSKERKMFTNEKKSGEKFGKEIEQQLRDADHAQIATGYFGWKDLDKYTPQFLEIAKRGSCKLLFGMIFHERATLNQKKCLEELNEKLKAINNDSGVFVTIRRYHGKVYRFLKKNDETIFVGSSNCSTSGFKGNMEFNLKISDPNEKKSARDFLEYLFIGEGLKKKISRHLDGVELKLKKKKSSKPTKTRKTLKDFEIPEESFPQYEDDGFFTIKHRPNDQPRSSLNLYFDKGRKFNKNGKEIFTPRPWYEVEITSRTIERKHKDYPKGEWVAFVHDKELQKFYKLDMVTASGDKSSPKGIMTSKNGGGRATLGELIKGKMEAQGALEKYQPITDEVLEEYGRDNIALKKISDGTYIMIV